jgi:imidazoleglycerol phosphate dehydratase HisB
MRESKVERKTLETEVSVSLNIDGSGKKNINTGIKFFDHMLDQVAAHGYFDLNIEVKSHDNDPHHILEDTALVIGEAFRKALGDKTGINRYGWAIVPMDEALALCSLDFSGRPYCVYEAEIADEQVRDLETVLVKHFFTSFSVASAATVHVKLFHGEDTHHIIESMFKSFAKALRIACSIDKDHPQAIPSTKGVI